MRLAVMGQQNAIWYGQGPHQTGFSDGCAGGSIEDEGKFWLSLIESWGQCRCHYDKQFVQCEVPHEPGANFPWCKTNRADSRQVCYSFLVTCVVESVLWSARAQ